VADQIDAIELNVSEPNAVLGLPSCGSGASTKLVMIASVPGRSNSSPARRARRIDPKINQEGSDQASVRSSDGLTRAVWRTTPSHGCRRARVRLRC
jgi:hypothetical protein